MPLFSQADAQFSTRNAKGNVLSEDYLENIEVIRSDVTRQFLSQFFGVVFPGLRLTLAYKIYEVNQKIRSDKSSFHIFIFQIFIFALSYFDILLFSYV